MQNLVTNIPLKKIAKVKIYVNAERKTMDQIKREIGCDYMINAGLFNMQTFAPINVLVSGGHTLAYNGGKLGFSFFDEACVLSYDNNVKYPEHVSGYPCLIHDGKKAFDAIPAGLEGHRGRSAMGITKDSLILRAVQDVMGNQDFTLDELYQDMIKRGCIHAINLDGGGSTQCDFAGKRITSGRIVHNFVCVWLKHENTCFKTVRVQSILNIRKNPPNLLGINTSPVIGTYANGARVEVLESRAGWCRTNRGWVCGMYLK